MLLNDDSSRFLHLTRDSGVFVNELRLRFWCPRTLAEIEKHAILDALKFFEYNRTYTANALGISLRTLRNKLRLYKVPHKTPAMERVCVNSECRIIVTAFTQICPKCGHGQRPLTAPRYL